MKKKNLKNIKFFNTKLVNAKKNDTINKNLNFSNIINPFDSMLFKSLTLPPSVKLWVNSVYSYNKNFIKNLPIVDNIVNKIIKSYFSINPLVNNPNGKKTRLLVRRFNRLSLNRILVSKSEIKHFSDKIFITVFIFNKKKISLLYKLKNLYNNMFYNINNIDLNKHLKSKKNNITNNKKVFFFKSSKIRYVNKSQKNRLNNLRKNKPLKMFVQKNYLNKKLGFSIGNLIEKRFYKKYTGKIKTNLKLKNMSFFSKKINKFSVSGKIYLTYKKNLLKKKYLTSLVKSCENYRFKSMNKNKLYFLFKLNSLKKNNLNKFSIKYDFSMAIFLNTLPLNSIKKTKNMKLSLASLGKTNKLLKNISLKKNKRYLFYKDSSVLQLYGYNHYKQYSVHCISKEYYNLVYKYSNSSKIKIKDKILNYKFFKKAATSNMTVFIKNSNQKENNRVYNKVLNYYVNSINKYKLYNNVLNDNLITIFPISYNKLNINNFNSNNLNVKLPLTVKALNNESINKVSLLSIDKLKALYALINSYNNIKTLLVKNNLKNGDLITNKLVMKKLYKNNLKFTYKTLKKYLQNKYISKLIFSSNYNEISKIFNKDFKLSKLLLLLNNNFTNNSYYNILSDLTPLNRIEKENKNLKNYLGDFLYNIKSNNCNFKKQINTPLTVKKSKMPRDYDYCFNLLIIKLEKIDRFFELYKNIICNSLSLNLSTKFYTYVEKSIINIYKAEFVKEFLTMELLYLYNLKLITFNNNIFKDWFLSRLKNTISKIYNKKVIFNFISLKYIYFNSDIFTQAIAIKLRNYRINRLNKVLYKAVKTVSNANIISSTNDIRNPIYKYIENHFNKKLFLHKELFYELNSSGSSTKFNKKKDITYKSLNGNSIVNSYFNDFKPFYLKIRRLNQLQANTINFIKNKSVFGVRIEASGRLTKRSTASRSIFMIKYKGGLKHNIIMNRTQSTIRLKNNRTSNLQFTRVNSKTRNGSFGLKGWINNN